MRVLIYILGLLIVLSACKKKLKTKVEGTVIHAADNQPLGNVEVRLTEHYGFGSNTGAEIIKTTITNQHGNFSFNFRSKSGKSYSVAVSDTELFMSETKHGFNLYEYLENGKTNTVLLNPMKPSYTGIKIDGTHGNDSLRLEITHEYVDSYYANELYEKNYFFDGGVVENISGNYIFKKEIYNNNMANIEYDTVYMAPYQEQIVEINF